MKVLASLVVAGAALGLARGVFGPPVGADPSWPKQLANDTFDMYRVPWREGVTYQVDGGCQNGGTVKGTPDPDCGDPNGNGGHTGFNNYAIDFGTMGCGDPIRADALGGVEPYTDSRYGNALIIKHPDGQGSWFAHLPSAAIWDELHVFARGDYISDAGDTGVGTGCHLHYQVNNNWAVPGQAHTAVNQWLSGTFYISH
jgi:murein DD-endopeptidase MepM/ murein hydrolase activator NlpD